MINNVFVDIETVPAPTFMMQDVADKIRPPATYTKPETIAAWMADKAPAAVEQAQHGLGLMPAYAQIVCLSFAFEDDAPEVYSGTEAGILSSFFEDLSVKASQTHNGYSMRFIGHNILGFDLPCIWWACLRNRIPYAFLPHPRQVKPWETMKALDTLYQMAGTERKGMSLGNMAKLFGIHDPLPDVDGSMVWDMYKAGRIAEIEDYCAADVEIVRELYKRIKEWV